VDGEEHDASSTHSSEEASRDAREDLSGSGWTTTKQAAKVLGVSRRSVQGYVGRGILTAREEGEGVSKRFLISIDSLNDLMDRRRREAAEAANFAETSPQGELWAKSFANADEGLRHLIERFEARTAEATELRIRLQIAERAQSTLEEERTRALDELAEERRRREHAERESAEVRGRLNAALGLDEAPETGARPSQEEAEEHRRREPADVERDELRQNVGRWPSRRGILLAVVIGTVAGAVLVIGIVLLSLLL
jgi:hypothetical protein